MKRNLRLKQNHRVPKQCRKKISGQKEYAARRAAAAELRAESKADFERGD